MEPLNQFKQWIAGYQSDNSEEIVAQIQAKVASLWPNHQYSQLISKINGMQQQQQCSQLISDIQSTLNQVTNAIRQPHRSDQQLDSIQSSVQHLTEVCWCLTNETSRSLLSRINQGLPITPQQIVDSCLRSKPELLFSQNGAEAHHIGMLNEAIVCRASANLVEIRSKTDGQVIKSLKLKGLHCSLEARGVLYLGLQSKQVVAVDTTTLEIIGQTETAGSVNSLSLGDTPDYLVVGQQTGFLTIFQISPCKHFKISKIHETQIVGRNISKVVRTTKDDFALATESGVVFCEFRDNKLQLTEEGVFLKGVEVTELSEYAADQYVAGQWIENDFITFDRKSRTEKTIKQPLWCNALCTDLVPLPGYHPVWFPYYISKTMRSLNLIDFREHKCYVLVETKDMPADCFAYKKLCLFMQPGGALQVCYVTSDRNQNTVVAEVVLWEVFMKALGAL